LLHREVAELRPVPAINPRSSLLAGRDPRRADADIGALLFEDAARQRQALQQRREEALAADVPGHPVITKQVRGVCVCVCWGCHTTPPLAGGQNWAGTGPCT
jgi:hypothetical protein